MKLCLLFIPVLLTVSAATDFTGGIDGLKGLSQIRFVEAERTSTFLGDRHITDYPNIRIQADYSSLTPHPANHYIQYILMPPILDYFQSALRIKYPLIEPIQIPRDQSTLCKARNLSEDYYSEGINADYILIFNTFDQDNSLTAANTQIGYCTTSGRPVAARININLAKFDYNITNQLQHERSTYMLLHEIVHALGFYKDVYDHYLDSNGNKLAESPLKQIILNNKERLVLDVQPLTQRLRDHFGCDTIPGALLEDYGSSASAVSHFERRLFMHEMMTSGIVPGFRISEFTLAVLEGTGWYVPDYSLAEPFYFGKNKGCEFYEGPTIVQTTEEYCVGRETKGCSPTGRSGGWCSSDSKADNYSFIYPKYNHDCGNIDAQKSSRLRELETYGLETGSRCFSGTLNSGGSWQGKDRTGFCFTYKCRNEEKGVVLEVKIGDKIARCLEKGNISVEGFRGRLDCPDPEHYCNTIGKNYCPRGCMGRGKCIEGRCLCREGYIGMDCGLKDKTFTVKAPIEFKGLIIGQEEVKIN